MASDTDGEAEDFGLFNEPEGFYQPENEATFALHRMLDSTEIKLRLVGHNPLWVGTLASSSILLVRLFHLRNVSPGFFFGVAVGTVYDFATFANTPIVHASTRVGVWAMEGLRRAAV